MSKKISATRPGDGDLFRSLFDTAPDAMIVVDREGRIVLANPQAERLFGYAAGELAGNLVEALLPQAARGAHVRHRDNYMDNPRVRPMGAGYELTGIRQSGETFPVEIGLSPIRAGDSTLFAASIRDISETRRVRQALTRARHDTFAAQIGRLALESPTYETAVESTPALIASALEIAAVVVLFTDPRRDQLAIRSEVALPPSLRESLPAALPQAVLFSEFPRNTTGGATLKSLDAARFPLLRPALAQAGFRDAAVVPLFDRYEPMGAILVLSKKQDAFERDALHFLQSVANLLAAAIQRSRSEEQLAHSQRLDAVGQLTGGIAHDFNNLLTVVSGNLQLMETGLADHPELGDIIESALRAVDRGAALTRKLLAFARRQRLMPREVSPAQLLSDLQQMLQRTLGERIAVTVECGEDVPVVFADPGELDAALINLALNARDAMPRGGDLRISAERSIYAGDGELDPGTYVVLRVADTGTGMPPEVLARALEPFFTTKESGKGNGLGLSMVYGFVKQSGGRVAIESTLGAGTRVDLHLPARAPDQAPQRAPAAAASAHEGRESILVVEDERDVRAIATAFLRSLGYTTYEAESGERALELLGAHPDVALLFSDIVLGSGMTGYELLREARKIRTGLPVLLTSGYERAGGEPEDAPPPDVDVLRKPYRREQLAAAVRKAFGEEARA
ncbi:MAG TPA: PAS domain S-box protein [Rhodanobacteraceae bacterium]|jgi:PAS domain S-box-containing protein